MAIAYYLEMSVEELIEGTDAEKDWYGDWKVDFLTGRISMQVTPTKVGMLKLSVRLKNRRKKN
jgi:hypothetical protein